MRTILAASQEAKDDLFYGQVVIIVARWFLIATGVILVLWSSEDVGQITLPILFLAGLTGVNFFVHGRYLMRQPLSEPLVYVSVMVDLAVIVLIVAVGTPHLGRGLASSFFVLLYPVLLALGLVFQWRTSLTFAAVAIAVYVIVAVVFSAPSPITDGEAAKDLLRRVVTLATVAGLGTYYWRIQRNRRRDIVSSRAALLEGVERLTAQPGATS